MTITLKHVAELAGVTPQTVSRAFLSPQKVKETTRLRIHAMARDLGYRPNVAARALQAGTKTSVGLMVGTPKQARISFMIRGWADLLNCLCQECEQRNLNLTLGLMHQVIVQGHDLQALPRAIEQAHVGPVVALGHMWDELATTLRTWKIPTIVINGPACGLPAIQVDELYSINAMVDHLASLGHQRIALINHNAAGKDGDTGETGGYRDTIWPQGYLQGIARHRLTPYPGWDHFYDCSTPEDTIDRNFSKSQPPTALITYDDQQLLRFTQLLRHRGLRVPEDVSLVALKDIGFTEASVTTITRMVAPTKAMANLAMQWVSENLSSNKLAKPAVDRLHAQLVAGESSAPPPASSRAKQSQ